jgi:DNA recombination protein RmuC
MPSILALAAAALAGALVAFVVARDRYRTRAASLAAALDAERRFAAERRDQAARLETILSQLTDLGDVQRGLSAQSRHMLDALRSPVVRGRWGEMQLKRVCELAQMSEYVDYVSQRVMEGESRLRPDLVVTLPHERQLVVDAKAPLQAYLDALETTDELDRVDLLRQHARQVRDHVVRLSAKAYWEQFDGSPEYVVLFLPGEGIFAAALQSDANLLEFAAERGIVLASPTTLMALLRAVAHGWSNERAARHAGEARALGAALHGELRTFAEQLDEVRRGLHRAVEGYNRSVSSIESRVLPAAARLGSLAGTCSEIEVTPIDARPRAG